MKNTFILVPTYNEISNIEKLLDEVTLAVPDATIVILDDNSPDMTWKYVQERAKKNKKIILNLSEKKGGIGKAYLRGFAFALSKGAEQIVQLDADLSHNPKDIPDMLELSRTYDLVIGSRYKNGVNVINWPMRRVMLSYFANYFVNSVTGVHISDCTSGFKCFTRKALSSIRFEKIISDGYIFQVEMNLICQKLGFKIYEKPIVFRERASGFSKMASGIISEAFFKTLMLRLKRFESYRRKETDDKGKKTEEVKTAKKNTKSEKTSKNESAKKTVKSKKGKVKKKPKNF